MIVPYRKIHIVGVGGAGMSALAKVLSSSGHEVSGTDLRGGPGLDALADLGISVAVGHHPDLAVVADLVVASSAVPDYDEELTAAAAAGVPAWRRPKLLKAVTAAIETIAATGTHGKTTTTALLLTALRSAGRDPSFVLGGDLVDAGTNGHLGADPLLILEADEAFRTFESLHLSGLVVTNIEAEHLGHFGGEAELMESFISVAAAVEGPVLSCADDPGSSELASRVGALTFGESESADWRMSGLSLDSTGSTFRLIGPSDDVEVRLSRPGRHIALDAAGALALLGERGVALSAAAAGLAKFRGVGRRWEYHGRVSGVDLYDDYAHHPTEVAAMVEMASSIATGRLWAVFQPHLYSRTERFSDDFGTALARADIVVVTDVYGAREEPVPGVTGELVSDAATAGGAREVHYVPRRGDVASFVAAEVEEGDLVLSMGAGDITLLHTELAPKLAVRA